MNIFKIQLGGFGNSLLFSIRFIAILSVWQGLIDGQRTAAKWYFPYSQFVANHHLPSQIQQQAIINSRGRCGWRGLDPA
jgi:hypothetical protein